MLLFAVVYLAFLSYDDSMQEEWGTPLLCGL
jgi:hypothetical protein